jgi:large subunit ribosomal protein L25
MDMVTLKATERTEKPKKLRDTGFIPGVLNGPGTASVPVKFQGAALNKIITMHGTNAKLWVEMGDDKESGLIKEIQRDPVDRKIIHATIQLISMDQEIKMEVPISFHGVAELERKFLQVQVSKAEVEVSGKAALIPEVIVVDVEGKAAGDDITAANFDLPEGVAILDAEDEIYAAIKEIKEEVIEETEETATEAGAEAAE